METQNKQKSYREQTFKSLSFFPVQKSEDKLASSGRGLKKIIRAK